MNNSITKEKKLNFYNYKTLDSCISELLDNTFCVIHSINNILYLIYANKNRSIVSYNLIDNKKIIEIKNAHNKDISNIRSFLDKINKRDLVLSISFYDNNLKVWNINNFECLLELKKINKIGFLYSACFLNDNNNNYIIISNFAFGGTYVGSINIFDFKGNEINEINDSCDDTYFIDTFYDKKLSKNYIITGNYNYVKSYDYSNNSLYYKYYDNESSEHISIIINNKEEIVKLIESSQEGSVRIWNFHSGELLNKISLGINEIFGIYIWNNEYIFIGNNDNNLKIIDIKEGKIINNNMILNSGKIISIKEIIHPKYGKCLISQDLDDHIKLWYNNKK